jgi:hypothetical protein
MGNKKKNEKLLTGNIDRRDFLCKSALVCCMMNIPFASKSLSKDSVSKAFGSDVNPVELAAYCGLYCGACDIYQKRISQSGNELKKVLDAYDFGLIANQVPGLEDYKAFYNVLNNLITIFGQCEACQKDGGPPQCQIRMCSREKGYQTCAECSSFPCDKVKFIVDGYPQVKDSIKEIKNIGLEKWCQREQERVNKGFRYSSTLAEKKAEAKLP